jgi:hypothetical protein
MMTDKHLTSKPTTALNIERSFNPLSIGWTTILTASGIAAGRGFLCYEQTTPQSSGAQDLSPKITPREGKGC